MGEAITREVGGRTFELVPTNRSYYGGRYGPEYDVFETTGGTRVHLNEGVDPGGSDLLADEVLLELASARRRDLIAIMRAYKIVAGGDYQYEGDYELLYSADPVGRYVVVSGDETYHWIHVVDTREEAADSVRGDILDQEGNEYPHHPEEILDLDTGRSISWKTQVTVELMD